MRRNCFKRLKSRSTWLRARYASRSKPRRRGWLLLVGITAPMWRRRRSAREGWPAKALSPATRRGRRRGRPRLRRTVPVSSKAGRAVLSWRSPPVRWKVTGLPCPSARTWILVEKPPRERPRASSGGSPPDGAGPAGAGGVLMSAHHARIHKVQVPVEQAGGIRLGLQGFEHPRPDTGLTPAVEAARDCSDCAIALRQVSPGRTRAQHPEDTVDDRAVVVIGAAGPRPLRGQQGRQTLPLLVRQLVTSHTPKMVAPRGALIPFA